MLRCIAVDDFSNNQKERNDWQDQMIRQKVEEWKNTDLIPQIAHDRGISGVISAQWSLEKQLD